MRKLNIIEVLIECENTPLEIKRKFVYATQCGDVLEIKKDRYGDITHYRTDSSGLMS